MSKLTQAGRAARALNAIGATGKHVSKLVSVGKRKLAERNKLYDIEVIIADGGEIVLSQSVTKAGIIEKINALNKLEFHGEVRIYV